MKNIIPLLANSAIILFMQIPFQYSLHIENENTPLEYKEFLAQRGTDQRLRYCELDTLAMVKILEKLRENS